MVEIIKKGQAHWEGDIKQGKGTVSTESSALQAQPYGFNTRFEGKPGTNPEELLGAAHSACFSMAFSLMLGEAGYTADTIDTVASVTLSKDDQGYFVQKVHLESKVKLTQEIEDTKFQEIAEATKKGCPVSRLFNADITMTAHLV